jgi:hypothetical protein
VDEITTDEKFRVIKKTATKYIDVAERPEYQSVLTLQNPNYNFMKT